MAIDHPFPSTQPSGRLAALEREIGRSRRTLFEIWAAAPVADRIFAVDRLLKDDVLSSALATALAAAQTRVRDAWVEARVASLSGAEGTDARLASLHLTVMEQERDALMIALEVFDALFVAAEGFLRRVPAPRGATFKELLRARELERARLIPILPAVDAA